MRVRRLPGQGPVRHGDRAGLKFEGWACWRLTWWARCCLAADTDHFAAAEQAAAPQQAWRVRTWPPPACSTTAPAAAGHPCLQRAAHAQRRRRPDCDGCRRLLHVHGQVGAQNQHSTPMPASAALPVGNQPACMSLARCRGAARTCHANRVLGCWRRVPNSDMAAWRLGPACALCTTCFAP